MYWRDKSRAVGVGMGGVRTGIYLCALGPCLALFLKGEGVLRRRKRRKG